MIALTQYSVNNIISINEYINQPNKIYESIFNKVNIYNRNTRLVNEGVYRNLPTDNIIFTNKESLAISEMLSIFQIAYLHNYLNNNAEILEGLFIDENNNLITESVNDIKETISKVFDKIPSDIKNVYLELAKLLKKGITKVVDFVKQIGMILSKLGDTLVEALKKLGFYNSDFNNIIEEPKVGNKLDDILGDNNNDTNKYLITKVIENINNKSTLNNYVNISETKSNNDNAIYENLFTHEQLISEGLLDFIKKYGIIYLEIVKKVKIHSNIKIPF